MRTRLPGEGRLRSIPAWVRLAGAAWLLAAPLVSGEQGALFARLRTARQTVYVGEVFDLALDIFSTSPNLDSDVHTSGWPPEADLAIGAFTELEPARTRLGDTVYLVRRYRATASAGRAGAPSGHRGMWSLRREGVS